MHAGSAEGRAQRAHHLLGQSSLRRRSLFIRDSKETVAHANAVFSRTRDLQRDVMEFATPAARIEGRFIGTIPDQVIALLVRHYSLNTAGQIVVVLNCDAARFLRQIVEARLIIKGSQTPLVKGLI